MTHTLYVAMSIWYIWCVCGCRIVSKITYNKDIEPCGYIITLPFGKKILLFICVPQTGRVDWKPLRDQLRQCWFWSVLWICKQKDKNWMTPAVRFQTQNLELERCMWRCCSVPLLASDACHLLRSQYLRSWACGAACQRTSPTCPFAWCWCVFGRVSWSMVIPSACILWENVIENLFPHQNCF